MPLMNSVCVTFSSPKTIVLQNEAEILFTKLYNMAMQSLSVTKSE